MDYGKKQKAKLLKKQGKKVSTNNLTNGEEKQAKLFIHQYRENHKLYSRKKLNKLIKLQHLSKKVSAKYDSVLTHLSLFHSDYRKIDKLLVHIALIQGGIIKLRQLRETFKPYNNGLHKGYQQFINYELLKQIRGGQSWFLYGYDQSHKNLRAIVNVLLTGFLTPYDIKKDLGLKSIKQANNIMKPISRYKSGHLSQAGEWNNHISINKLVKVMYVSQYKRDKEKYVTYGVRFPRVVVSTIDYIHFLVYDYKSLHKTPKYIKNHYTKYGQSFIKAIKETKPSYKLDRLMRDEYRINILRNQVKQLSKNSIKLHICLKYIKIHVSSKDYKSFIKNLNDGAYGFTNYSVTNMGSPIDKYDGVPFDKVRKEFPSDSNSKIINKCRENIKAIKSGNNGNYWRLLRRFIQFI